MDRTRGHAPASRRFQSFCRWWPTQGDRRSRSRRSRRILLRWSQLGPINPPDPEARRQWVEEELGYAGWDDATNTTHSGERHWNPSPNIAWISRRNNTGIHGLPGVAAAPRRRTVPNHRPPTLQFLIADEMAKQAPLRPQVLRPVSDRCGRRRTYHP